jgi:hypothetical protein
VVEQASEPVPELAYVTGADGRASVGLPPGEVGVRFFLPDGTAQTAALHVAAEAGREYVVRLPTSRTGR